MLRKQLLHARDEIVDREPDSADSAPDPAVFRRSAVSDVGSVRRRSYRLRGAGVPRPNTELR